MNYLLSDFEKAAREVAEYANKAFKTDIYTFEDVEVINYLRDYKDGQGTVLVCTAGIRNPYDGINDLQVDVVGPSEEALSKLLEGLKLMEKENYIEKLRAQANSSNNQKLN